MNYDRLIEELHSALEEECGEVLAEPFIERIAETVFRVFVHAA